MIGMKSEKQKVMGGSGTEKNIFPLQKRHVFGPLHSFFQIEYKKLQPYNVGFSLKLRSADFDKKYVFGERRFSHLSKLKNCDELLTWGCYHDLQE